MRAVVETIFPTFSDRFEGTVRSMYADVKGLVTVAEGDLIDPLPLALGLPFVHPDGTPATIAEITTSWNAVKNDLQARHLGWRYAEQLSSLRLTDAGVAMVVRRKLDQNDKALIARFPEFEDWPADAQLATHSMAWACGPAFHFPKLEAALLARNFATWTTDAEGTEHLTGGAAYECHMNTDGNAGLIPRNAADVILYENAAKEQAYHLDPDALVYPEVLVDPPPVARPADSGVLGPADDCSVDKAAA